MKIGQYSFNWFSLCCFCWTYFY